MRQRKQVHRIMSPEERREAVTAFKWGWFHRKGYIPHAGQLDIHSSQARYRIAIAGTRGGKSRCVGEEATVYLLVGATRVWLVGQSYATTEKEFRYIWESFHCEAFRDIFGNPADVLIRDVYNEKGGDMHLETMWGSEVKCVSLDQANTSAFGEEVDLLILCEPGQIKNPKLVYEQILHGRIATRVGDVLIAGTPAGRRPRHDPDGWLYEMYCKGLKDSDTYDPNYYTRVWASWENPEFKDDPYWIKSWMNPLVFAEQYEGSFIMLSGNVYTSFNPVIHVVPPFRPNHRWNRYEAIDPGFSGMFYWCAGVTDESGSLYIIDEYYDKERTYAERANAIWERRLAFYGLPFSVGESQKVSPQNVFLWNDNVGSKVPRTVLYIDPEDPQFILEFSKFGLAGHKANNDVLLGINRVDQMLRSNPPRLYITSNCVKAIEALSNHSWGEKSSNDVRKPANDVYKHPCDAIRYLCMGSLVPSDIVVESDREEYDGILLDELFPSYEAVYETNPYIRRMRARCIT